MRTDVPSGRQQRDEALQRAQLAIQSERPDEAKQLALDILKTNPGHLDAIKVLGYAFMMLGRPRDAIAPLEKLARSNRDAECATQLAIALRQSGRSDDAVFWLKRAIKRKPPFAAAFHELGFVLNLMQRADEAIAVLRQGVEVAPMMPEMAVQLGNAYRAVNDLTNARKYFAQALSINPGHYEAVDCLASVSMDERDYAQAAELFRHAMASNPGDASPRLGLGSCLLNLGDVDGGFACLRAATGKGREFYGKALKVSVTSGHGRFWLRPSAAAKFFKGEKI